MRDQIKVLAFLILVFLVSLTANAQSTISGIIKDEQNNAIPFATIAIYKQGQIVTGTDSDFDGKYSLNIEGVGVFDIKFSFLGYKPESIPSLSISHDSNLVLNVVLDEYVIPDCSIRNVYYPPLIDFDFSSPGEIIRLNKN